MLDGVELEVEESPSTWGASLWNLLCLHVSAWALHGHSCFLPGSKNKHTWLIVNFELSVGVRLLALCCHFQYFRVYLNALFQFE